MSTGAPAAVARPLVDGFGRPIGDLRVSVTDRCNLRCVYCIPEQAPVFRPREEILTYEETVRLVGIFAQLGVHKVRVTGGEPLLRRDVAKLIRAIAQVSGIEDLALTTNATRLSATLLEELIDAGLQRINISLDTLQDSRFQQLTRRDQLDDVMAAILRAQATPLRPVKVNMVVMRGFNDDEIVDFARFARDTGCIVRFIEFMPLEAGNVWSRDLMVPGEEVEDRLRGWRSLRRLPARHAAETAVRYGFAESDGEIGIIAPVTRAFCGQCNRARLTADGKLRTCLFSLGEVDLKALMRGGADDAALLRVITGSWRRKEPGHLINSPGFVRPERTMSAIGG